MQRRLRARVRADRLLRLMGRTRPQGLAAQFSGVLWGALILECSVLARSCATLAAQYMAMAARRGHGLGPRVADVSQVSSEALPRA